MNQRTDKTPLGPAGRHALDGMGKRKMSFDTIPAPAPGASLEESAFSRRVREEQEQKS